MTFLLLLDSFSFTPLFSFLWFFLLNEICSSQSASSRFVVLVFVYIIGGMIYMKAIKKAEGKEIVPNVDFWLNFHHYVKVLKSYA